jgi:hypothetical protein
MKHIRRAAAPVLAALLFPAALAAQQAFDSAAPPRQPAAPAAAPANPSATAPAVPAARQPAATPTFFRRSDKPSRRPAAVAPLPADPSAGLTREEYLRALWNNVNRNYPRANVDGVIVTLFEIQKMITPLLPSIDREVKGDLRERDKRLFAMITQQVQVTCDHKVMMRAFAEQGGSFPPGAVAMEIDTKIQAAFNGDRSAYLNSLRLRGITPLEDRRQMEEILVMQAMQRDAIKYVGDASPKRIAEFYERNKATHFTRAEQIRYRQIQLSPGATETNADVFKQRDYVLAELQKKTPFSTLVMRSFNKAPTRFDDGGATQWYNSADINEKVIAALKAIPDGGVTSVVDFTGPDGRADLHIFQRVEFRPGGVVPLAEVQDQIAAEIVRGEQNSALDRMMDRQRQKYFLRFY